MNQLTRRNILNNVMLTLTGVCTVLTSSVLFFILGFLVYNGWRSLNWDFFTKLPLSAGEIGRRHGQRHRRQRRIDPDRGCDRHSGGIPGRRLSGGIRRQNVPMLIRYTADLLNGVPSIVIGIFAWTVIVVPMHHFSAWAGGLALSLMMIPIGLRATEQFLRGVPNSLREGSLALGASKTRTILTCDSAGGQARHPDRHDPGVARIAGETAPLLFTSFNNQFWAKTLNEPTASLPFMIYYLCYFSIRRLASPGLGGRPGAAGAGVDRQHCVPLGTLSRGVRSKGVVT